MTTTFENKVSILSRVNRTLPDMPQLKPFAEKVTIGLSLATLLDYNIVTEQNDKIARTVEVAWLSLLAHYGIEDKGFSEAWEIDPDIPIPELFLADDEEDLDEQDD